MRPFSSISMAGAGIRHDELDVEEAAVEAERPRQARSQRPTPRSTRSAGSRLGYSNRSKLSVPSYITESVTPTIVTRPAWT